MTDVRRWAVRSLGSLSAGLTLFVACGQVDPEAAPLAGDAGDTGAERGGRRAMEPTAGRNGRGGRSSTGGSGGGPQTPMVPVPPEGGSGGAVQSEGGAGAVEPQDGGAAGQPAAPPCPEGCREIVAYPLDAERLCIDNTLGELISCSCGNLDSGTNDSEVCLKGTDGSRWLVARGWELELPLFHGEPVTDPPATFDTTRFAHCTAEEDDALSMYPGCDFARCAISVDSPCEAAATYAAAQEFAEGIGFGFPAYEANGCLKQSCETDADCAAEARCVGHAWDTPDCSFDSYGGCDCGSRYSYNFRPAICLGTDLAGPRGAWQSYRLEDLDTGWYWLVTPDGAVTTNSGDALHEAALSPGDLALLNDELNGYVIRSGAQNGFVCPLYQEGEYTHGAVTLVIEGTEYFQMLPTCLETLPTGAILQQF